MHHLLHHISAAPIAVSGDQHGEGRHDGAVEFPDVELGGFARALEDEGYRRPRGRRRGRRGARHEQSKTVGRLSKVGGVSLLLATLRRLSRHQLPHHVAPTMTVCGMFQFSGVKMV